MDDKEAIIIAVAALKRISTLYSGYDLEYVKDLAGRTLDQINDKGVAEKTTAPFYQWPNSIVR